MHLQETKFWKKISNNYDIYYWLLIVELAKAFHKCIFVVSCVYKKNGIPSFYFRTSIKHENKYFMAIIAWFYFQIKKQPKHTLIIKKKL